MVFLIRNFEWALQANMTDITNLFKATVKTVKLREKAQGTAVGPDKSILPTHKQKSEFSTHAKDVVRVQGRYGC